MEYTARLFNCTSCQYQVKICNYCDRGNIYCKKCSSLARGKSQRAASKRYQNTRQGKLNHAKRQQRYSKRQKQKNAKMTHQSSNNLPPNDLLPIELDAPAIVKSAASTVTKQVVICDFCSCQCNNFLRIDFLRCNLSKKLCATSSWPMGP
jgi:ribosomal protein L35